MDEALYHQFAHNIMRQGDAKALEHLCLALGVPPALFPYLHRWWQAQRDAERQEWEAIGEGWEKVYYVQSCWEAYGVDQVFWKCTCWTPPAVAWLRFFAAPPADEGGTL